MGRKRAEKSERESNVNMPRGPEPESEKITAYLAQYPFLIIDRDELIRGEKRTERTLSISAASASPRIPLGQRKSQSTGRTAAEARPKQGKQLLPSDAKERPHNIDRKPIGEQATSKRERRDKAIASHSGPKGRADPGRKHTEQQQHFDPFQSMTNGEHPAAAFARSEAVKDYDRRKDSEPGLVDPSTVPIDKTWQDRTYSAAAVAPLRLTKKVSSEEEDPFAYLRQPQRELPVTFAGASSYAPRPMAQEQENRGRNKQVMTPQG